MKENVSSSSLEREREILNAMLNGTKNYSIEDILAQSQKLDRCIIEYMVTRRCTEKGLKQERQQEQ